MEAVQRLSQVLCDATGRCSQSSIALPSEVRSPPGSDDTRATTDGPQHQRPVGWPWEDPRSHPGPCISFPGASTQCVGRSLGTYRGPCLLTSFPMCPPLWQAEWVPSYRRAQNFCPCFPTPVPETRTRILISLVALSLMGWERNPQMIPTRSPSLLPLPRVLSPVA